MFCFESTEPKADSVGQGHSGWKSHPVHGSCPDSSTSRGRERKTGPLMSACSWEKVLEGEEGPSSWPELRPLSPQGERDPQGLFSHVLKRSSRPAFCLEGFWVQCPSKAECGAWGDGSDNGEDWISWKEKLAGKALLPFQNLGDRDGIPRTNS